MVMKPMTIRSSGLRLANTIRTQMGRWILGPIFAIALVSSYAQDSAKVSRKLQIIPFPVIAVNPTAGFMYGVAPSATWYLGDPADTRISSFLGTVIYTTKDQLIITAKATTFFNHDSWNLLPDMRFSLLPSQRMAWAQVLIPRNLF